MARRRVAFAALLVFAGGLVLFCRGPEVIVPEGLSPALVECEVAVASPAAPRVRFPIESEPTPSPAPSEERPGLRTASEITFRDLVASDFDIVHAQGSYIAEPVLDIVVHAPVTIGRVFAGDDHDEQPPYYQSSQPQPSLVRDFDVEIAQGCYILDPRVDDQPHREYQDHCYQR